MEDNTITLTVDARDVQRVLQDRGLTLEQANDWLEQNGKWIERRLGELACEVIEDFYRDS